MCSSIVRITIIYFEIRYSNVMFIWIYLNQDVHICTTYNRSHLMHSIFMHFYLQCHNLSPKSKKPSTAHILDLMLWMASLLKPISYLRRSNYSRTSAIKYNKTPTKMQYCSTKKWHPSPK